ncbi:MAG TPA: DUF2723 domain-containing protein, partial [Chloroflexota bacterium]|nr:DUF2723 domain-containing protein [Chloroflexota bacterium]
VSALAGAVALAFVYGAGVELARSWARRPEVAGLGAAAALGVSHTFWLLAVRPDVYTLQMALVAAATWATLRWRRGGQPGLLVGATVACAAALTNHVQVLGSGPGLAALSVAVPRAWLRRLGATLVVALVVAGGLLALVAARGVPLGELAGAVGGSRPQVPALRDVLLVPAYLAYQFPLSWPLALLGISWLWGRDRGALLGLALLYLGNVLLVLLRLRVRDQFLFFLPSYLPVALLVGAGCAAACQGWGSWAVLRRTRQPVLAAVLAALVLAPLALYPLTAVVGGLAASRLAPARQLPGRDPVTYYLFPGKPGYGGARAYGEGAMAAFEPQAAVVADWLPYQTLRYLQAVEGQRQDVELAQINAGNGAQLRYLLEQAGRRPLYLADNSPEPYYEMEAIQRCFSVTRQGPVFRLHPRAPTPVATDGQECG